MMVAVGLVRKGYDVTVVSDRTPEEIRNGRVTSSQGMQATPIAYEREMGLRLWEDLYQPWEGIEFNVLSPEDGTKVSSFARRIGSTNGSADWLMDSIDQRVKMPANDNQDIADFLLRGTDDANRLMPYFFDEVAADDLIAQLSRRVG